MENASKALLIAGSVLIAIVLIATSMKVFDSTSNTVDSVGVTMQATEVGTFNNKFTPYLGQNRSRADVVSLANVVIANNASENSKQVFIKINGSELGEASSIMNAAANLSYTDSYNISVTEFDDGGYIYKITVD